MSKKHIVVKVNVSDSSTLAVVSKMFAELADIACNTTLGTEVVAAINAPQVDFAGEAPATPVLSVTDAFQHQAQAPTQQVAASNVLPFPTPAPQAVVPSIIAGAAAIALPELDKSGLPWDVRIHTSNRAKTQKDIWKEKKGVDPAFREQVIAELRAAISAPVIPQAVAPQAPAGGTYAAPQAPAGAPMPNMDSASDGFPSPPAGPPPTGTPTPAGPSTFPELMQIVTFQQAAKKIEFSEIVEICQRHGLANLALTSTRPDLIPQVYRDLESVWSAR